VHQPARRQVGQGEFYYCTCGCSDPVQAATSIMLYPALFDEKHFCSQDTLLHVAAWKGHTIVSQVLVGAGSDLNATDKEYEFPG